MTHKDYKYFKQQLKQGSKITLLYEQIASTGEVATTHSSYKSFKQNVKQLQKEHIRFSVRIERNKYRILQDIKAIAKEIRENADLISPDGDTIWHAYANQLDDKLFDLQYYV